MTHLIQLLYTRISHDLAGPSGTVYNGAELLTETPSQSGEMVPFIMESANALISRLKFFRQAFGIPGAQAEDATAGYLETLSADIRMVGCCENQLQKVLVMVGANALIYGGKIEVLENKIKFTSDRSVIFSPILKDILEGREIEANEQTVPALYAVYIAREQGREISVDLDDKSFIFRF